MGRSVRLVTGEDGRPSIEWAGDSRWLHVSIGLLGQVGAMRAIGPTLRLPDQVPPTVSLISLPVACARKCRVKLLLANSSRTTCCICKPAKLFLSLLAFLWAVNWSHVLTFFCKAACMCERAVLQRAAGRAAFWIV